MSIPRTGFPSCASDQFRCSNALCIPINFHCDGYKDCDDGSDEKSCQVTVCPGNKFMCPKGGPGSKPLCINRSQLCDGKKDCEDGADEEAACCEITLNNYYYLETREFYVFLNFSTCFQLPACAARWDVSINVRHRRPAGYAPAKTAGYWPMTRGVA